MATGFEASNQADFIFEISATDFETGEDIDFTDAEVAVSIKDKNCVLLTALIDDGITLSSSTVLRVQFTSDQMNTLCVGGYNIGAIYRIDDETTQLFTGTFNVYDGIAEL